MNRLIIAAFLVLYAFIISPVIIAGENFSDHNELSKRLRELAEKFPRHATLSSIARTDGEKDIWMLAVSMGDHKENPAIAVVGGVDGDHLLGPELVIQMAATLLEGIESGKTPGIIERNTFYFFPDMSPDAREQYFRTPKYPRKANSNSSWTDRYGRSIEHPYNDLNGDGIISLMRVRDSAGDWIAHPEDDRIMIRARRTHGETGKYSIYPEGVDFLNTERWNQEGVHFNRNFSFRYPVFTKGSGHHAVSEPETRALAEFLFEARNIWAVLSFGPANNLAEPIRYNEREATGRIISGILQEDAEVNRYVSDVYRDITGGISGPPVPGSDGDFFQWAYFHYGRFSFSTPGWSVPMGEGRPGSENYTEDDDFSGKLRFLKWADEQELDDFFIPWEEVLHPLFPEKQVEVGGIMPFRINNPPYEMVAGIAGDHYRFLIELAGMRPETGISNIKTEQIARGLYRITADIDNKGVLPTVSKLGERNRWVQKTVIRIEPSAAQKIYSGKRVEVLDAIDGGKTVTRSWLVRGRGEVIIKAGADGSGFDEISIKL